MFGNKKLKKARVFYDGLVQRLEDTIAGFKNEKESLEVQINVLKADIEARKATDELFKYDNTTKTFEVSDETLRTASEIIALRKIYTELYIGWENAGLLCDRQGTEFQASSQERMGKIEAMIEANIQLIGRSMVTEIENQLRREKIDAEG